MAMDDKEELRTTLLALKIANEQLRHSNSELKRVNANLPGKTEELDAAGNDLHNLYQSIGIAVISLDNDLAVRAFSPAAAELLDLDEGDIGTPAACIDRSFSGADVEREARRVIDDFEPQNIEVVHRRSGRQYVLQIGLYRTIGKIIKGVTASLIDIDDLKKIRMDLRIREKMLSLVTDSVPMLMAYIDTDEIYRFCNTAYHQWFGLEKYEVEGKRVVEVIGTAAYDVISPSLELVFAGEQVRYVEKLEYHRREEKWVRVRYVPHNDEGQVKGVIVCVQDESVRVRRERGLARLAAIVNSSHEVIIGKNTEGIITDWNRGAEELFGYTAAEAVGAHCFLTVPVEEREELSALHTRLLRGESVEPFETVRLAKDDRRIDMLMSLSAIQTEEGEVIGISTVARDISDRLKAEKQLAEFNENLEEKVLLRTTQLHNLAARLLSLEQVERRKFSQLLHDEIRSPTIISHNKEEPRQEIHSTIQATELGFIACTPTYV
jgi:two-component system, chemotaxis family, CheB/CheR fusion protein